MKDIEYIKVKRKHIKAAIDKDGDYLIKLALADHFGTNPIVAFPRFWIDNKDHPTLNNSGYMNIKLWNWIWDWDDDGPVMRFFRRPFWLRFDRKTGVLSKV